MPPVRVVVWMLALVAVTIGILLCWLSIRTRLEGDQSDRPARMAWIGMVLLVAGIAGVIAVE